MKAQYRLAITVSSMMLLVTSTACKGSKPDPPMPVDPGKQWSAVSAPRKNVFLRASFDQDPRHLVGRFMRVGSDESDLDENRSVQSKCTKYVQSREVRANQRVVEMFNSSNDVKVGLGFNPAKFAGLEKNPYVPEVGADVGNQKGSDLVVDYTVTRKLISEVTDPEAFEKCCDSDSRACSNLYIGEFLAGSGSVYVRSGRVTDVGVDAGMKGVSADVKVHDGWSWTKSTSFEDSFFAFRVYDTYLIPENWTHEIPERAGGQFFVGISPEVATEDIARDIAMRHARQQAIKYLGTTISTSSTSEANMFDGYTKDERVVSESAQGIAKLIKGRRYKTERIETTKGWKWKVKVLAWFPDSAHPKAAQAVVNAADKAGKLTPENRQVLQRVVDDLVMKNQTEDPTDASSDAPE